MAEKSSMKSYLNKNWVVTYAALAGITFGFLVLIKALNISYPLHVTSSEASNLSVVGEGKIEVVPDKASLDAGILVVNAQSVNAAQTEINNKNNAIVTGLEKLGIDKKDVKTSNYSVTPNQDYTPGGQGKISGYNGNVTLTVTVRDIALVPEVINAVTSAGANQVYSVNYSIDNPEKYREEARNKAIANAREQAKKLSSSLGISLGRVVNIVESSPEQPGPFPVAALKDAMGGGSSLANTQPGTQTVTSVVTLYFDKN